MTMKKSYSFLMAAALMAGSLTSCTVNDDIQTKSDNRNGEPISFTTGVQTRGTAFKGTGSGADENNPRVGAFKVYAFTTGETTSPYINGGVYTWSTDIYVPDNTYYWPATGNLDFLAVYPSDIDITVPAGYQSFSYTVPTAIGEQKDLMTATMGNQTKTADALALAFTHKLSQISFSAEVSTNLSVIINEVGIYNVKSKGDFSGTGFAVDESSEAVSYVHTFTTDATVTNAAVADLSNGNVMLLVPQTTTAWEGTTAITSAAGSYIKVKLKVKNGDSFVLGDAGTYKEVYIPLAINWTSGKHYTYKLQFGSASSGSNGFGKDDSGSDVDLTGEGSKKITFTASVTDWTDESSTITF